MEQSTVTALTAAGMDVPVIIERFGGNEALFLKFLRRFPTDPSFGELEAAMRGGAREALKVHCHTLKGVSGNLGLTPLFTACSEMMAVLRANDEADPTANFQKVKEEYLLACALVQRIG